MDILNNVPFVNEEECESTYLTPEGVTTKKILDYFSLRKREMKK